MTYDQPQGETPDQLGERSASVPPGEFPEQSSPVPLSPATAQMPVLELTAAAAGPAAASSNFVYIAPGSFIMGSPIDEEGRDPDETQHQVTLTRGFYLQTTEVTQAEWQRVMGNNPWAYVSCGSNCPVETVTWLQAVLYANALSRLEGFSECYDNMGHVLGGGNIYDCAGYRLPTEAEWEYAARAGTTASRYGALERVAWYEGDTWSGPHAVGLLEPNAWGLYDMLGNVWEWTHDWYGPYGGAAIDPVGAASGSNRVLRGGGWCFNAQGVRAAMRCSVAPGDRYDDLGFRVARTAI
ncbi:MAG: formylglycine-generating enzyme family protein [Myxococcales bacterium]|nr:formylglycine-generating enzyme family protein [Myxococcales bacterium]